MSRINIKKRRIQLQVREKRKAKLAKLRQKFSAAKTEVEKEKIMEKVNRISPWLSKEEFLGPSKNKK